ncbi:HAMP domain-containing histidine kinase [Sphingobacterium sp. SRCM116780]|uniref:sensor histidine kinase n=1 Tax=Sphingobacterium sp. SRCM116780 TaxID=2907623 RepID=UPI001F1EA45B|nr:HAMP domain-containing sensor histidine kinase [Sphingobacterium sp. SRCM116780]UIR56181.1 HAMP domain-containing histidine kinase [Sphingobacterium sp. SRCM116780]
MELKPRNYIFIALFLVLIGIQAYLLLNSFQLKKREIYSLTKEKLGKIDDHDALFDNDLLNNQDATAYYIELAQGKIIAQDLKKIYEEKAKRSEQVLTHYVDSLFAPFGYQVKLQKVILRIDYKNLNKTLIDTPIIVYKTTGVIQQPIELSSSTWTTAKTVNQLTKEKSVELNKEENMDSFLVLRKSTFEVVNLNWIVFKELIFLLLNTFFILLALLFLFYKTYQNLQKQQKQIIVLHDIVDNISHELKTPIATLKIASKTMRKLPDVAIIDVFDRQIDRLEQTLHPLMEGEEMAVNKAITSSKVNAILSDFQLTHTNIQFNVSTSLKEAIPINDADFTTVLLNLLDNSIKYGGTQLDIVLGLRNNLFTLQVSDNGLGIDQAEIPYIFEKFYRIQKDNIHNSKGLGLGLYLVKKIVDHYRGQIHIDSKLNQGTTFTITLPNEYETFVG